MAKEKGRKVTPFNLGIVFALCMGSLSYGYSFAIVSTTLGQPSFYTYFDLSLVPTSSRYSFTNSIIGAINACFCGGGFIGALFVGWASDYVGRRKCLFIATPIAILGGAFQGGAVNIAMFLVGRLLSGFSVGILVVLIPIFQAEIAPPAVRGFLVGQHAVILVLGYGLAAWIGFACFYSKNPHFQWRFPLCVQTLWPLIMLCLAPFMPESPRWLLAQGRRDEAWQITKKLHQGATGAAGADDFEFAKEEFYQMSQQVAADVATAANENVWTLFKKPSYRKRMVCAFVTMFGNESTGILVIYNYCVLLYEGLGYTGYLALLLAAVYVTVAVCGNYISSLILDKIGRKAMFVTGLTGCGISLCFEAALNATYIGTNNKAGLAAGVLFIYLHVVFYACCIDATSFVLCSEIFPSHIRGRGMAFSLSILFLSTVAYLEAAPTALAKIGWKYYLVFILLTLVINVPLAAWIIPETKGLSLEEIGEKFGDEVVVHLTNADDSERKKLHEMTLEEVVDSEKPASV